MICYIVGALRSTLSFSPKTNDLVIAADKGYEHLLSSGIRTDVLLGDFDSINTKLPKIKTIKYPKEKDNTDTDLAIEYAMSLGYKTIVVYGCIGGRFDHTFANIGLLYKYTQLGIKLIFVDGQDVATAIKNSEISFSENCKGTLSVFSLTEASSGVYETGLKYELENSLLHFGTSLGVSNEFIGKKASVSVINGCLMICTSAKNLLDSSF